MTHVLVVEDEPDLAALLEEYLKANAYDTTVILDGLEAFEWLKTHQTDLVLLDLMLPSMDGISICKELRKFSFVPIIMLTARVEEIDRLLGLELGADDYICKPYSPREVIARAKSVIRRSQPNTESAKEESTLLSINEATQSVSLGEKHIKLTNIELSLLALLLKEPARIFSRQFIMDHIYSDYRVVSDRTVDSHIKKLRKKLSEVEPNIEFIHSIYGAGYKFQILEKDI